MRREKMKKKKSIWKRIVLGVLLVIKMKFKQGKRKTLNRIRQVAKWIAKIASADLCCYIFCRQKWVMFSSAPLFFDACISKRIPVKGGFLGCLGEKKRTVSFYLSRCADRTSSFCIDRTGTSMQRGNFLWQKSR